MGDGDPLERAQHGALATADAASITQLLQRAALLCYDMFEAQVMCEQIRRRLDAIALALRDAPASSPRSSSEAASSRFAAIVAQFHAFLARSAGKDTVYRIVSSRVVVQQCRRFHEMVDALLAPDALAAASQLPALVKEAQHEVHSWTNRFENARENLHIALTELSRDRMAMMRDLLDRAAQEDALMRIMYEFKRPDSSSSPMELQVIQHAFNTIARMSRAKAPVVPAWFLALYDMDTLEREAREARGVTAPVNRTNSVVASVHHGTYLGAAVLVTFLRLSTAQLAELVRTVTIWCRISPSPHVVRIVGASHVGEPFVVVEDVRSSGSLAACVAADPQSLWTKLHGAALGLCALHDQSVVHGALTPSHLVVAEDGTAMIADNVVSALQSGSPSGEEAAALGRKAPELQRTGSSQVVTAAADVYAFGLCVLDAIASSSAESSSADPTALVATTDATAAAAKPASVTSEQWELVQRMCAEDAEQRPEMAEVVAALAAFAACEAAKESEASADAGAITAHEAQEEDTAATDDGGEEEPMAASASVAMATPSVATAADAKALAREEKKRAKEAEKEKKRARKMSRQDASKPHCIVM